MKRTALLAATILFCASPLAAMQEEPTPPIERSRDFHDISATMKVDPARIEVGMPVVLTLSVSGDAASRAIFPTFEDTFGAFDVRSVTPITPEVVDNAVRGLRIELVSYEAGEHVLPNLAIDTDGRELLFDGDPVSIEVATLVGPTAGPEEHHDIRQAISVPLANSSLAWWVLLGVLALSGFGFLVWWLLSNRHGAEENVPADAWAHTRLDALESRRLPEHGHIQQFFFELTDIARSFIERRYDIHAPERTTQEFIVEAQRHQDLDPDHATLLGRMLRSADMVKFAGDRPARAECERSMDFVRRFVEECGPRPEHTALNSDGEDEQISQSSRPERMRAMGLDDQDDADLERTVAGRNAR